MGRGRGQAPKSVVFSRFHGLRGERHYDVTMVWGGERQTDCHSHGVGSRFECHVQYSAASL